MLGESMAAKLWTWFTKAETSGPFVSPFSTLAAVGFCRMPWLKVLRTGVMSAVICLTWKHANMRVSSFSKLADVGVRKRHWRKVMSISVMSAIPA